MSSRSADKHATTWPQLCEWRTGLIYPATREQAAAWRSSMRMRARRSKVKITTGFVVDGDGPGGVGWAVLARPRVPAPDHAAAK